MSRLAHRLRRLEATGREIAGARPCAQCGGPTEWRRRPPGPGGEPVRVLKPGEEPGVPDVCPSCGRALVIRVTFDTSG